MTKRQLRRINFLFLAIIVFGQLSALVPPVAVAYAQPQQPPMDVRLVPDRDSPDRPQYDRQNLPITSDMLEPEDDCGRWDLFCKAGDWLSDRWQDAQDLWTDFFTTGESGSFLSRIKGILIGFAQGLGDFITGIADLVKQLLSLLWEFLTDPAAALTKIRAMITGVIEAFRQAFSAVMDALSADPPQFGDAAMEVAVMLGYQAIVDALKAGLIGRAIGRGLFELVASVGPTVMARVGGRIADVFTRAGEMANGALSRVQAVTDAKRWALGKLESARAVLPFTRTKHILSSMIDDTLKPGQLERNYVGLPEHFGNSNYVRDRMDELEQLAKDCVTQGAGSRPCQQRDGHWNNIRGEFREARMRDWIDSTVGGRSRLSDHDVTKNGWDDFRDLDVGDGSGDRKYVFGEAKDRSSDTNRAGVGDFSSFMSGSPPRFNRTGFEARLNQLLSDGVIDATEQADILKAIDDGRVEIVVFGGGTDTPFTGAVNGLTKLPVDGTRADGSAYPDVPVRVHVDK
jgi:hypothetical protein